MNTHKELQDRMRDLLRFKSDADKIKFELYQLHSEIMRQVQIWMEDKGWNPKKLAEELKVSEPYISQMFSGDRIINLKKMVLLQRIFKKKFYVSDAPSQVDIPVQYIDFKGGIPLVQPDYDMYASLKMALQQAKKVTAYD